MTYPSSDGALESWNSENDHIQFVIDIAEYTRVWRLKKFRNRANQSRTYNYIQLSKIQENKIGIALAQNSFHIYV